MSQRRRRRRKTTTVEATIPSKVLDRAWDVYLTMREAYHDSEGEIPPDLSPPELYGFLIEIGIEAMERKLLQEN